MIIETGKQRRFLRAKANTLKPGISIGKNGLTDLWIKQLEEIINKKELVKISILANSDIDKKNAKEYIELNSDIVVVQIIGNTILAFKESIIKENRIISKEVSSI